MPETACPSPDELAQMLNGILEDSRLESVLEHVDHCQDCQQKIECIQTVDPLAESLADLNGRELRPSDNSWMERSSRSRTAKEIQLPAEIGPYRLLETIAVGGMGTVYEARHRRLGRPFAVKLLHSGSQMTRSEAEMVRSEWRTHGRLVHPNIVGATDAGIADGQPYLVTERVDGVDLSKLVRQHGPLQPADACEIVRQAADGLQYAHEQQIIHGDVKPSNLMLNRRGVVKLLDLGTAKQLDASGLSSSRSGTTHGTLAYMAPEQLTNRRVRESNVNLRTDIYSLGCTLYCLLTGQPPFAGTTEKSNQELIEAHRTEQPPPIGDVLDSQFNQIDLLQQSLDRMLAKDPADRFESMEALLEQIEPLCSEHNVGGLLNELGFDSEYPSESGEGGFDLTGGLTTLLKIGHTRNRWVLPLVAVGVLSALAAGFILTRNDGKSNAVASQPTAPSEIAVSEPQQFAAKTSTGEDILHRTDSVWTPAPRSGTLDGLVLEPAKHPRIDHWQIETVAPRGRVRCLRWSADGEQIATVSTDGHVRVFDWIDNRLSLRRILTQREHRFVAAAFHPQHPVLYACSAEKLMRIDLVNGQVLKTVDTAGAFDMEWVNDHNLVSVSSGEGISLFDPNTLGLHDSMLVKCEKTSWSRDGDRVAYTSGTQFGVREMAKTRFAHKDTGYSNLDQIPLDIEFTTSIGQVAVLYPHRIDLLARGQYQSTFSVATQARLESVTFGESNDKMMIGTTNGIQQLRSAKMLHSPQRHQQWGRNKVAWNPKQDCIAVGQNGVLQIVDDQMRQIDSVGGLKSVSDVKTGGSGHHQFLLRSGKVVTTDRDGGIQGWATFLPDGKQVADELVSTSKAAHLGVRLFSDTTSLIDIPVPADLTSLQREAARNDEPPLVRSLYRDGKYGVELWDNQTDQWQSVFQSDLYIRSVQLSPNRKLLAIMVDHLRLCIIDTVVGTKIVDRSTDEVGLQNGLVWIDDRSILIAGASNMRAKNMGVFDVQLKEFSWVLEEAHHCSAAGVAPLSPDSFLQAGAVHNVRSTVDGQVQQSIQAETKYGRRHGRIYLGRDSNQWFSWGYDNAAAYESNASDGVVCWNADNMMPEWTLVDVGEEETVTLSTAGQIISATSGAADQLVWIVATGNGVELKSFDEFAELTRIEK